MIIGFVSGTPLLINEVGVNFHAQSYIEVYAPSGIEGAYTTYKFGVTILTVEEQNVEVHSIFEIPVSALSSAPFFFIIGSPDPAWKTSHRFL